MYACDQSWWLHYVADVPAGPERWTLDVLAARCFGLHWIDSRDELGLSFAPGIIHQGGNSGYQALGLAHNWGARRVILLGYDMQRTGGQSHWHGDHKGGLANLGPALDTWAARFEQVARDAPGLVLNATRETAIRCFPRVSLVEALGE